MSAATITYNFHPLGEAGGKCANEYGETMLEIFQDIRKNQTNGPVVDQLCTTAHQILDRVTIIAADCPTSLKMIRAARKALNRACELSETAHEGKLDAVAARAALFDKRSKDGSEAGMDYFGPYDFNLTAARSRAATQQMHLTNG